MATPTQSSSVASIPLGLTLYQAVELAAYMKMMTRALELFEDDAAAAEPWLSARAQALGGETPEARIKQPGGIEAVLDLIGQLEHGVAV